MNKAFSYFADLLQLIKDDKQLPIKEMHLCGGRKSGKTLNAYEFALLSCIAAKPNTLVVHCYRQLKLDIKEVRSEIEFLCGVIGLQLDRQDTHKSENWMKVNGNLIRFRGLYNRAKESIPSIGIARDNGKRYSIRVFDETYQFTKKDIDYIQSAMGGADNTLNIYTSNPWVASHWYVGMLDTIMPFDLKRLTKQGIYEQWKNDDGVVIHYTNFKVNELLKQSDIDLLEANLIADPVRSEVEYYGMCGTPADTIYGYYLNKVRKYKPNGITQYCIGVDYGEVESATTAMLCGATMKDELAIIDEYYYANKNNAVHLNMIGFVEKIVQWLRQVATLHDLHHIEIPIVVDWAAQGLISLLEQEVRKARLNFKVIKCKKLEVLQRIDQRKYYMSRDKYYIHDQCPNHYRELQNARWVEGKQEVEPIDIDDHTIDAVDYAATYFWTKKYLIYNHNK